ncbi:MAG: trypsin-like serine protease [Woeseiaceae bacterium]
MRINKQLYFPALALIFVLALPSYPDADHHDPVLAETQGQTMARPSSERRVELGGAADKAATLEWRKRRVYARARELSKRGIHVSKGDLDDWVMAPPVGPVEPELHWFVSELKGQPTTSLLSVGMLMGGKSLATAYSRCTVTLTQPDTILTARHCLSHTHGDSFWVYFPYSGIRSIPESGISFFCNDGDASCSVTIDDLAIAKLDAPFTFLLPTVSGSASTAANGQKATIVGYGLNSPDLADYGIKREGEIELASCKMALADELSLCFEHPLDAVSGTSIHAACNNDSGGPMLTVAIDAEPMIGVASQMTGTCEGAGEGRYVNVTNARYQEWLKDAYCDPACPGGDPSLIPTELIRVPGGYLDDSEAEEVHTLTVPDGVSSLIVTLNHGRGWFPYQNDFDLEIQATLNPACVKLIEAEVCEVSAPAAGIYTATVKKVHGEAYYQLSAVALLKAGEPDIE